MNIILIGGGKYAGLLYNMFYKQHHFMGYLDDVNERAYVEEVYMLKRLGNSGRADDFLKVSDNAVIAIGSEGETACRGKYFNRLAQVGFQFPVLIHPTALIADNATIGKGTVIQYDAVIHPKVALGKNCVVSTKAIVGHDSVIGDNVYIAPGVIINGSVHVGNNTFLGTGAVVIQKRTIGNNCVIGASACVISDIDDNQKAVGVPAKVIGVFAKTMPTSEVGS
jgi:UDP-perosamine 4-acetyltransferase